MSAPACAIRLSAPLARGEFRVAWCRPKKEPREDSQLLGQELRAAFSFPGRSRSVQRRSIDKERDYERENRGARRTSETSASPEHECLRMMACRKPASRRAYHPIADTDAPLVDPTA